MSIEKIAGKIKILVVEDSAEIQEATSLIFDLHWPQAVIIPAMKGGDGISKMKSESPDVVLLDLGLPDMDGLRVLKEIRSFSSVPVIILTVRGDEMDKVRGLEMGADDYVVKPFAHKELLARIKAVLSRKGNYVGLPGNGENGENGLPLPKEIVKISRETGQATRNGNPVKLTSTERSLLKLLAEWRGVVVPDKEILKRIWGEEYLDCDEYLQTYFRRLHEKLEQNPEKPKIILKDGNGYKISSITFD